MLIFVTVYPFIQRDGQTLEHVSRLGLLRSSLSRIGQQCSSGKKLGTVYSFISILNLYLSVKYNLGLD